MVVADVSVCARASEASPTKHDRLISRRALMKLDRALFRRNNTNFIGRAAKTAGVPRRH